MEVKCPVCGHINQVEGEDLPLLACDSEEFECSQCEHIFDISWYAEVIVVNPKTDAIVKNDTDSSAPLVKEYSDDEFLYENLVNTSSKSKRKLLTPDTIFLTLMVVSIFFGYSSGISFLLF